MPHATNKPHPASELASASRAVYTVAGGTALGSVAALLWRAPYLEEAMGLGFATLGLSLILALLGFLSSRRSMAALVTAMALVGLWACSFAARAVSSQGKTPIFPTWVLLFSLLPMSKGIAAIQALSSETR